MLIPFSPSGVTRACRLGPMIKPKTWANEIMDTAFVRSLNRVASDRYERHTAVFEELTPIRKREMSIQYLTLSGFNSKDE